MDTLLIILGALLAIGGSFLAQRNQSILDKEGKDKIVILEIISILLDYHASQEALKCTPKESATLQSKLDISKHQSELADYLHRLSFLSLQVSSKKYFGLSVKVTKFALEPNLRTESNLHYLTREAQESVNKELIEKYEREIGSFPDKL